MIPPGRGCSCRSAAVAPTTARSRRPSSRRRWRLLAQGDNDGAAEAETRLAMHFWVGGSAERVRLHMDRAAALVDHSADTPERAQVLNTIGRVSMLAGDLAEPSSQYRGAAAGARVGANRHRSARAHDHRHGEGGDAHRPLRRADVHDRARFDVYPPNSRASRSASSLLDCASVVAGEHRDPPDGDDHLCALRRVGRWSTSSAARSMCRRTRLGHPPTTSCASRAGSRPPPRRRGHPGRAVPPPPPPAASPRASGRRAGCGRAAGAAAGR